METGAVWVAIDEQRAGLADVLDDLRPDEWERPSLCAAWRVRHVGAHLTLAHMGPLTATAAMVRARGSFDRMIRDTAVRRADLPPETYGGLLRAMVGSRRKAPGVTPLEPLIDVLVHGQDITIPLGRLRAMPVEPTVAAAERVWSMGMPFHARRRLRGLRLRASDADWDVGEGELVEGPIGALLLRLTGRGALVEQLTGPGAALLPTA